MKTQYYTASSLDGFIATPDDSLEWLFPLGDINTTGYPQFIAEVGALAMGSTTYEWMLRHVVRPDTAHPGAWPYQQPTWVFSSRSHTPVPGARIRFVRGDVRAVHEEMRAAIDRRVAGARAETTDGRNSFRVIPVLLPGVERPEPGRLPEVVLHGRHLPGADDRVTGLDRDLRTVERGLALDGVVVEHERVEVAVAGVEDRRDS